jgi:hypothetical protein
MGYCPRWDEGLQGLGIEVDDHHQVAGVGGHQEVIPRVIEAAVVQELRGRDVFRDTGTGLSQGY